MTPWTTITAALRRFFHLKPKHRTCARCKQLIKRNHHWTAKAWTDGKPRHWNCEAPVAMWQKTTPKVLDCGGAVAPEAVAQEVEI